MLEELADDRAHVDRLRQARHARAQAADPAHDEIDRCPRLRRAVQGVDHLGVDEAVHLHRDAPGRSQLGLALDSLQELGPDRHRRDEQLAVLALAAVPGEVVEQLGQVGAEIGVGGQQAEVLVAHGRLRVVVAGADVAVAADAVGLLAHDEEDLGVRLEADQPVHDVDAGLFEQLRPFDVGLLVESCLELDERDDLLVLLAGCRGRRCGTASA